jgi:acyl-CoA reductase-like NAD-dependent aldehyde dehydrogenase
MRLGYKTSGWGRELGMNGLEAYLTTKGLSPLAFPSSFPP